MSSVEYSSGASNTLLHQASGLERLNAKLSGLSSVTERIAQPAITEETMKGAIKDVQDGNVDSDRVATIARDVYRKTATSSLYADVEVSGFKQAKEIEQHQITTGSYDRDSYDKSWKAYSDGKLSTIKDPIIKENVSQKLNKIGAQHGAAISNLQLKQQKTLQLQNLKAKIALDSERWSKSMGINDADTQHYQAEVIGTYNTMIQSGLISPYQAELEINNITKNNYKGVIKRGLQQAINNGTTHEFFDEFNKADHSKILPPDEVDKLKKGMYDAVATDYKIKNAEAEQEKAELKLKEQDHIKNFDTGLIENTLTIDELDDALANNEISLATHDNYATRLSKGGTIADNSDKKLFAEFHLMDISEQEIYDSPDFTNDTKVQLLKERKALIEKEGNWMSSQNGREGRQLIKRHFGILDGTLLSSLDFDGQIKRDYDGLYRQWYARVQSLPLEQRAQKSYQIADEVIANYKKGKVDKEQEEVRKREEVKKQQEAQKEKDYNDSTYGKFMNMVENAWENMD